MEILMSQSSTYRSVTGKSGLPRRVAPYGLIVMTLLNFVNYIDRYMLPKWRSSCSSLQKEQNIALFPFAHARNFIIANRNNQPSKPGCFCDSQDYL
jgi:hypothetical protein